MRLPGSPTDADIPGALHQSDCPQPIAKKISLVVHVRIRSVADCSGAIVPPRSFMRRRATQSDAQFVTEHSGSAGFRLINALSESLHSSLLRVIFRFGAARRAGGSL